MLNAHESKGAPKLITGQNCVSGSIRRVILDWQRRMWSKSVTRLHLWVVGVILASPRSNTNSSGAAERRGAPAEPFCFSLESERGPPPPQTRHPSIQHPLTALAPAAVGARPFQNAHPPTWTDKKWRKIYRSGGDDVFFQHWWHATHFFTANNTPAWKTVHAQITHFSAPWFDYMVLWRSWNAERYLVSLNVNWIKFGFSTCFSWKLAPKKNIHSPMKIVNI